MITAIAQRFGWGVVLIGWAVYLLISRMDSVKRIIAGRNHARNVEREQNWDDSQDIIARLQEETQRLHDLRIADSKMYETQIAELREQVRKLINTVESSEIGNSRLRHALRNSLTWGTALAMRLKRLGHQVTPFQLEELLDQDEELGLRMQDILRDLYDGGT